MSIVVRLVEGYKFEAICRGHSVIVDQPKEEGGSDQGMAPIEFFNLSLASSVAYYAIVFLKRRIPDLKNLEVQSSWQFTDDPHRIAAMHVNIMVPRILTDPERKGLQKFIEQCTITNTLNTPPSFDINIIAAR